VTCEVEPAAVWPAKDPGERLDYGVDFERALARLWARGASYSIGVRVRPTRANGFEYECTTPGQTASREPEWPASAGATVTDGSAGWICRALTTGSLTTALSGTPTWTADSAITVSSETVASQMAIAFLAGGVDGQDYTVMITAPCADGTIRTKVCILPVRRAVRVCAA
jgi:hypothetical protein